MFRRICGNILVFVGPKAFPKFGLRCRNLGILMFRGSCGNISVLVGPKAFPKFGLFRLNSRILRGLFGSSWGLLRDSGGDSWAALKRLLGPQGLGSGISILVNLKDFLLRNQEFPSVRSLGALVGASDIKC